MPQDSTTWGIVATVKAPADEVLRFAAYHLDLGAHRLFLYLDEPDTQALAALGAHPKVRVRVCDDQFWASRRNGRPKKHQVRQSANATHAYSRAEVDWLAHIDVDEFIWPQSDLACLLDRLPPDCVAARVRPIEALAGTEGFYKAFIPPGPERPRIVRAIYPRHGAFVKGGFMSHLAGKLFVRTGLDDVEFRIHNAFVNGSVVSDIDLTEVDLCHNHGHEWEDWLARYRFRLERGSYRPDLAPNLPRDKGGITLHELLSSVEAEKGEAGLRAFFDELSAADPETRARLEAWDMVKHRPLELDRKVAKHFRGTG